MAFDELVPLSNITLEIKPYDRVRHSLFGSGIRGYVDYSVQSPAMIGERSWRTGEQTHTTHALPEYVNSSIAQFNLVVLSHSRS